MSVWALQPAFAALLLKLGSPPGREKVFGCVAVGGGWVYCAFERKENNLFRW